MPDVSQSLGQLAPFLARQGRNYAAAEPILKLRDGEKLRATKQDEAIKERYKHYLDLHKSAFEEVVSSGQLVSLMCRGEHMLEKRRYGVGWYIRPINETEGYRKMVMNFMGFYRHTCCTKILSVSPTVKVIAADDDPRSIAAAKAANPAIDYWEEQCFTERFRWRTALDILNNGTRIHRVRWNPFLPGPMATSRRVEQQEMRQPGYANCKDCDYETDQPDEFKNPRLEFGGQCPNCGSNAVEATPSQTSILSRIVAGQKVSCGAPEVQRMGLAALRWDLRKDAEESSYLIYRQNIKLGDVKLLIGDAILPDTYSSDDKGLDVLERLGWAGQPFDGGGSSAFRHIDSTPTLAEFWMSPEDYADIQLEETQTVSGETLPAGRMSDVFTGPICAVGLNDMSLVIGVYAESHRDQIVSTQWMLDADSGAGRGLQDAAATQKRYNAADGHIYQGLAQHATPGVMIDKRLLKSDQGEYLFRPGHVTELNLTQLPAGMDDIRKAMYVAQPGQVNSQYIAYTQEFLPSVFQVQTLAVEFSDHFVNIDPRTATGSNLLSSLASSLFGPTARVNADSHVSIVEKVICLLAKYDRVGRYYPGKDGTRGMWLCSADLDGKLTFTLESGSQNPSSPVIRQAAWNAMVQASGGIDKLIQLKQTMPGMFKEVVKMYEVKIEAEDPDTISTICLGRLDQMKQMFAGGVIDPEILVSSITPPPVPVEPKHSEKMVWWSDFLDTEEGLKMPLPLRDAIARMYYLHENLQMMKAAPQAAKQGLVAGVGAAAAQAPAAMGQMAMQRMSPQPQIDEGAARNFLKQAGGNKNKARKLALRGGR